MVSVPKRPQVIKKQPKMRTHIRWSQFFWPPPPPAASSNSSPIGGISPNLESRAAADDKTTTGDCAHRCEVLERSQRVSLARFMDRDTLRLPGGHIYC